VRLAITVFTATGSEAKVVSGPEPFAAAKDKLRAAMHGGHEAGVMEIWTAEGVSDRFTFKGSQPGIDAAAPEAATDGGSTPPDSTPAPAVEVETNGFNKMTHKRRR